MSTQTIRPRTRRVSNQLTADQLANRRAFRLTTMLATNLAKEGHAQPLSWPDDRDLAQSLSRQLGVADSGWYPNGAPLRLTPEQVSDLAFQLVYDQDLARQLALLVAGHTTELHDAQPGDEELIEVASKTAAIWQAAFTLPPTSQDDEN